MAHMLQLKGASKAALLHVQSACSSSALTVAQRKTSSALGATQSSQTTLSRAQPRHLSSAAAAALMAPRGKAAADMSALTAAAAPCSSSSHSASASASSSSSSSSSASAFPFSLLAALVGAAGGALMLTSVEAEAASSDLPQLDGSLPSMGADESSAAAAGGPRRKKKKGLRGASIRKSLDYPGKLANLHRDASSLLQIQTGQGMRFVLLAQAWPQDQAVMDKNFTVQAVTELGGANGSASQVYFMTRLGRKHALDAGVDSVGNVQGSYKFTADFGMSVKPSFQLTQNGNAGILDVDWKGREWGTHFQCNPANMEASLAMCAPLTQTLAAGVELHYQMMNAAFLNGGFRYKAKDGLEQFVASKKDTRYLATYYRVISEQPHVMASHGFPPVQSAIGSELMYNPASGKSDLSVGLRHIRHTYVYHATLSSAPRLELEVSTDPMPGFPLKFGLTASVPYDGSGEPTFGGTLTFQA